MMRAFDPDAVLSLPLMANLSTLAEDGAPRNAPVWFIWEEGVLWMLGDEGDSSVTRLQREPRCAVEIVHFDNAVGVLLHCGLRGSATVETSSPARFQRLLLKYLGPREHWNDWFIDTIAKTEDPANRMIRLQPASIFTNNVSFFRTGPDYAWP